MVLLVAVPADAQTSWDRSGEGWCDAEGGRDRAERFCEILTARLVSPGRLDVDGGTNGGVEVRGWDGADVEVRAKVWATADDASRATELARQVRVEVEGGVIRARGPESTRRESWGVSYEVRVPRRTDLDIRTHNGGVSLDGVTGALRFEAQNGGVHLSRLAGDVRGSTVNGGLHVELDGSRWQGAGLDVHTTNGGVDVRIPDGYSADFETGTVNGGIQVDFPVTVQGRVGRRLRTTLGDGGSAIKVVTTNGGVRVRGG
jgi:DUF4097 and DUF4098 domain-containing protein YvlB